ncbi:MAG: porin [Bacteroidetes bacterium]|nr:porin [Bacteroidota bacterium]
MKNILIILSILLTIPSFGQVSFSNGNTSLEITGGIISVYNYRFYDSTETDHKKNNFALKTMRLGFDVRRRNIEYSLEMDMANILTQTTDPSNPALLDASITYKGLPVEIIAGYQKLPYSHESQVTAFNTPYLQRPEMLRGSVFSRRDVGVTLHKDFWQQKINVYGGVYSGQGELSLNSDNDKSGNPEYASRVDFSYPAKMKYREVDEVHVPFPIIQVGFNGRYMKKALNSGADYSLFTINGEKFTYGMDVTAEYKGISFQWETHQLQINPVDRTPLQGKPTNHYFAGGNMAQLSYHSLKLSSVFSLRYDDFNPNDIVIGDTHKTLCVGYNYLVGGSYRHCIKIQYFQRLADAESISVKGDNQLRIGWQYRFK